jgi:basic amino acid/polyamine antiporter, APA family
MIIGAGIFAVPSALAANLGPYAPLAFMIGSVVIGSIAVCFAEGGSRVPTSGGAYGYIEAAYGPFVGYIAGTLLWFSDVLACASIAAALADVAVTLTPPQCAAVVHALVIVCVIGGIALVNIGGVTQGSRLVNIATVLKLIPLAIFIVAGMGAIHLTNYAHAVTPSTVGLGRALILALFLFTGMEAALCASGEVTNPARTIPRALVIAILSVTLLYVVIQFIAQGILGPALALSTVPLADAMDRISPALRLLMLAGATLSMFGCIGSDILGSPRILFAFARDGLLPRILGRVHSRTHTPHIAILCYAGIATGLALAGNFAELAVLATLTVALVYIAACAAAWSLVRRGTALAGAPLNFRRIGVAAATGVAGMLVLIALAERMEIVGLVAGVAVSAAIYLVQTRIVRHRRLAE